MAKRFGGFATYGEYLEGRHWRKMRSHFCGPMSRCYACDTPSSLQIHHTSYERLGKEHAGDFIVVCRECHQRIHDTLDERFTNKPLAFKVARTDHVFPALFARTLRETCKKYGHHQKWEEFHRLQKPKVIKLKPPKKRKEKKAKKPKRQDPAFVGLPTCGKGNWRLKREAKRHHAEQARRLVEEELKQRETEELRQRLGPEFFIRKLPTLSERIKARIALRQKEST